MGALQYFRLRALGGGPLIGNKLVRLVYVDEAGISNRTQEPFLVVGAVIVHADEKLAAIEDHLAALIERHIPAEHRTDFVFHATELFNGGGKVFVRPGKDDPAPAWPLEKRLKIADELAAIPGRFDLPVVFGFVERAKLFDAFKFPAEMLRRDPALVEHLVAFMSCAMMVEQWMRRLAPDEICMMIVEDNDRARALIRDTIKEHQSSEIAALLDDDARKHFPFTKIKEDPLFQPKRRTSALQIADFCAYVFKRILMGDARYERVFDPIRPQLVVFEDLIRVRPS